MYDYTLLITIKGKTGKFGYQSLLSQLEMGQERYMSRPLTDGGTPQVQAFINAIKPILKAEKIVAEYQGEPILSA